MKKFGQGLRAIAVVLVTAVMTAPLTACLGAAVGAGAMVGVAAAREGGLRNTVSDANIRLQIIDLWFQHDVDMFRRLSMTVREGRVLVTGNVPTPDARVDAIRLAWQAEGVKQVINEINVDNSTGITGYANDVWITGQLKTRLLFDKYVQSINYTVDTVNATVYLMGVAQDQKELDRVVNHARTLSRVRNVVSYVRLRGETPTALKTPPPKTIKENTQSGASSDSGAGWTSTTRRDDAVTWEPLD